MTYLINNKLYERKDLGVFVAMEELPKEQQPVQLDSSIVAWTGPKLPFRLWHEILAFMRWSQAEHKSEALALLLFNTKTQEWNAWAPPQVGIGMTIRADETNPLYKEQRKAWNGDWVVLGSIHHHCNGSAFASGVDRDDEAKKEGLHLTVGKMEAKECDIHARITVNGYGTVETNPMNLIATADNGFLDDKDLRLRLLTCTTKAKFPEVWKTNYRKEVYSTHSGGSFSIAGGVEARLLGQEEGTWPPQEANGLYGLSYEEKLALILAETGLRRHEAHSLLIKTPSILTAEEKIRLEELLRVSARFAMSQQALVFAATPSILTKGSY